MKSSEGAVAILVAILATVLVGVAAFATDFGLQYSTKRNLQKAADAAALAAAGKIISLAQLGEDCTALTARWTGDVGGFRTTVQGVADAIAISNSPLSQRTDMQVACSSDNKRLEVTYSNRGSTNSIFGGIFGVSTLAAARSATADIFPSADATGLRPYAVCDDDANKLVAAAAPSSTQKWVAIPYPNATCGNYGGNWYSLNCPEDGNNGVLDTDTLNGCKSDIGVIPHDSTDVPNASAPVAATIKTQCTAITNGQILVPAECLLSNPGKINGTPILSAWDTLLSLPGILIPTFNPTWNTTYGDGQVAACKSGGDNGCYPVESLATVKVCAYQWQNKFNYDAASTGSGQICAGISSASASASPANILWLALTKPLQVTGSSGPGGGAVGDPGVPLGTRLIK